MKPDSNKVSIDIGMYAAHHCKDLGCAYSEAVRYSYKSTGRLAPGFDAKDLIAWIRRVYPDVFDEKGKRKPPEVTP
ncbi:MAG: hypothetical protein IMZ61_01265 [Planctomycetes bacterium]|nr:hypothetical protein [Planctomycetota bacterium]